MWIKGKTYTKCALLESKSRLWLYVLNWKFYCSSPVILPKLPSSGTKWLTTIPAICTLRLYPIECIESGGMLRRCFEIYTHCSKLRLKIGSTIYLPPICLFNGIWIIHNYNVVISDAKVSIPEVRYCVRFQIHEK